MIWRTTLASAVAGIGPLLLVGTGNAPLTAGLWVAFAAVLLTWMLLRQTRRHAPLAPKTDSLLQRPAPEPAKETLEVLPDPLIVVNAQDRVEFANGAAQMLYRGFEPGVLLSIFIRHPEVLSTISLARSQNGQMQTRFTVHRPKERFFRVIALPLEAGRMVVAFYDETELHRAEHMRAGFLANASHELRTPLASLSGYIDTLRGHARDDPQAQARFLDIMADQAARMGRLIQDLLSLSRIEMDKHIAPKTTCDLAVVLSDVCDAITPIAKARDLKLACAVPKEPVQIIGERDQIIQVVQNLMDNAIKYTPKGETINMQIIAKTNHQDSGFAKKRLGADAPRLQIVETPRLAGQNYAVLEVRDVGPGISPEHLPRLGGRFYRVEEGKSATLSGTGLGLAIVKHIVSRHRGGLSVESKPDHGAVFSVAFPLS